MPTRNVHLTKHLDHFIESGINSGRFSNASEIVREGLRLLEQREEEDQARLEWLRAAAKEGFDAIDQGDFTVLNSEEAMADFFKEIHQEASGEVAAMRERA